MITSDTGVFMNGYAINAPVLDMILDTLLMPFFVVNNSTLFPLTII